METPTRSLLSDGQVTPVGHQSLIHNSGESSALHPVSFSAEDSLVNTLLYLKSPMTVSPKVSAQQRNKRTTQKRTRSNQQILTAVDTSASPGTEIVERENRIRVAEDALTIHGHTLMVPTNGPDLSELSIYSLARLWFDDNYPAIRVPLQYHVPPYSPTSQATMRPPFMHSTPDPEAVSAIDLAIASQSMSLSDISSGYREKWKNRKRIEHKKWCQKVLESREPWLLQIMQNSLSQAN